MEAVKYVKFGITIPFVMELSSMILEELFGFSTLFRVIMN